MIICDEDLLWCLADMAIVAVVVILMVVVIVVLLWCLCLRPIIVVVVVVVVVVGTMLLIMVLVVASACCNSPWWWFLDFALRFATERGQGVIFRSVFVYVDTPAPWGTSKINFPAERHNRGSLCKQSKGLLEIMKIKAIKLHFLRPMQNL